MLKRLIYSIILLLGLAGAAQAQNSVSPAPATGSNAPAGGSTTQVQYNSSGLLAGDSGLTYASATKVLTVGGQHESTLYNAGNSSTALTVDWNNSNVQSVTLTGNVTFTFSNPASGGTYVIQLFTGAGSFTAAWPASVVWPGGTGPTITVTASKMDLITFTYNPTTGHYYGSFNQNYAQ